MWRIAAMRAKSRVASMCTYSAKGRVNHKAVAEVLTRRGHQGDFGSRTMACPFARTLRSLHHESDTRLVFVALTGGWLTQQVGR